MLAHTYLAIRLANYGSTFRTCAPFLLLLEVVIRWWFVYGVVVTGCPDGDCMVGG